MKRQLTTQFPRVLCNSFVVLEHAWHALNNAHGGGVIECGVCEGYTSAVLNFGLRKNFHTFRQYAADTFSGFPYHGSETKKFKPGQLAPQTSVLELIHNLRYLGIVVLRGKVENTLRSIENEEFAFVFLDLDLELPTQFCWQFFHDKIREGGRIGFHDYNEHTGHSLKGIDKVVRQVKIDRHYREVVRNVNRGRDGKFIFFERR